MVICATELEVPLDFIYRAAADVSVQDQKCFSQCVFRRVGFLNKNELLIDNIIKDLPKTDKHPEKTLEAIKNCANSANNDKRDLCQTSFKIFRCYIKEYIQLEF